MVAWSAILRRFLKYFGACELTELSQTDTEFHGWSCNQGISENFHTFPIWADVWPFEIANHDMRSGWSSVLIWQVYQTHIYPSSIVSLCLSLLDSNLQRYNFDGSHQYMPSQLGTVGFEDFLLWVWQCIFMEETLGIAWITWRAGIGTVWWKVWWWLSVLQKLMNSMRFARIQTLMRIPWFLVARHHFLVYFWVPGPPGLHFW